MLVPDRTGQTLSAQLSFLSSFLISAGVALCTPGFCACKGESKRQLLVSIRNSEIYLEILFLIIIYVRIGNDKRIEHTGSSFRTGDFIKHHGTAIQVDKVRNIAGG